LVDDSWLPADVFLYSASKVSETEETHHEQSRPFWKPLLHLFHNKTNSN